MYISNELDRNKQTLEEQKQSEEAMMSKMQKIKYERKNLIYEVTKLSESLKNYENKKQKMHNDFDNNDKLKLNQQLTTVQTTNNIEKQSPLSKPENINEQDWQQAGLSKSNINQPKSFSEEYPKDLNPFHEEIVIVQQSM